MIKLEKEFYKAVNIIDIKKEIEEKWEWFFKEFNRLHPFWEHLLLFLMILTILFKCIYLLSYYFVYFMILLIGMLKVKTYKLIYFGIFSREMGLNLTTN